jgi:hypothetical protein
MDFRRDLITDVKTKEETFDVSPLLHTPDIREKVD